MTSSALQKHHPADDNDGVLGRSPQKDNEFGGKPRGTNIQQQPNAALDGKRATGPGGQLKLAKQAVTQGQPNTNFQSNRKGGPNARGKQKANDDTGMGLNTPMGTVQITQSEHNFDAHNHDADRDGIMDQTMNSQEMRKISAAGQQDYSPQRVGNMGGQGGMGGPAGPGLQNAMSQQQFMMGIRGSQQLMPQGAAFDSGSVQMYGNGGQMLGLGQGRFNTLASLQQKGDRMMVGGQPHFIADESLLHINDSEFMGQMQGSPTGAHAPWMSNIASGQQIFNSPSFQTVSGMMPNQSHIPSMAQSPAGALNPAFSSFQSMQAELSTGDMLSSEIKKIRLRISDYYRSVILEPILFKLWKLMIDVQFDQILLQAVSHVSHIPLAVEVYEVIMPIYEVALGVYYQSSYYIAKRPVYKAETVHFDRFCYDFISLFGVNILFLEIEHLEQIIRKVYSCVSFNFSDHEEKERLRREMKEKKGGVAAVAAAATAADQNMFGAAKSMGIQLRALECVEVAFPFDEFNAAQKKEEHVKIEVPNRRKTSEDDFIEKVKQEKDKAHEASKAGGANEKTHVEVTSQSQHGNQSPRDKDDDDNQSKESVFGKMKTLEEVAAEQQAKKDEKKRMLTQLKTKRENMRPLVVFTGVKDNPLPYEQKYLRTQAQTKEKETVKLPEIKESKRAPKSNRASLNKTVEAKSSPFKSMGGGPSRFRSPESSSAGMNQLQIMPTLKSALNKQGGAKAADNDADQGAATSTPAQKPTIPMQFNSLDRSPVRPKVKNLKEMQHKDVRRYQIFKQYSMLHEFTVQDGEQNASLKERHKARQENFTRLAREVQTWPDRKLLKHFTKYEVMNMKTYKCRNRNNLSPANAIEFDPNSMKKDPTELYGPRINAFRAIKLHLDNVEQASSTWLQNRSNAFQHLSGISEEPDKQQIADPEVLAYLQQRTLNQVSSRNLNTNIGKQMRQQPMANMRGMEHASDSEDVHRAVMRQHNSEILDSARHLTEQHQSEVNIIPPQAAYQSAAGTQINLPGNQAPPTKAQDPKQLMMEQNKQKFLPKNFSFAIIQSENAMKVGVLGAQQQQANANAMAYAAQVAQVSGHHQMAQDPNQNGKIANQPVPAQQISGQLVPGITGQASRNQQSQPISSGQTSPQGSSLNKRNVRRTDTGAHSGIGQSKRSLNQDLSHLPFAPPSQQMQVMKTLEEPLAIQGQQSTGVQRQKVPTVQTTTRNQQINIGLNREKMNPTGKGVPYPKTGFYASVGSEQAMLKTLVVSKLTDDGERDSMRGSQGKVGIKKQLSLVDRAESAVQQSQDEKEELINEEFDGSRLENIQDPNIPLPRSREDKISKPSDGVPMGKSSKIPKSASKTNVLVRSQNSTSPRDFSMQDKFQGFPKEIASTNPHALAELQVKMPFIQGTKKQMSTISKIETKTGMIPQIQPLNLTSSQQATGDNQGHFAQNNMRTGQGGRSFIQAQDGQMRADRTGRHDSLQIMNLNHTIDMPNGRFQFDIGSDMGVDSQNQDPQNRGSQKRRGDHDAQGGQRGQADRKQFLVSSIPQMNSLDDGDQVAMQAQAIRDAQHGHGRRMPALGQTHPTVISVHQSNASNAKESQGARGIHDGSSGSHGGQPSAVGGASIGKRHAFMAPHNYQQMGPDEMGGFTDDNFGMAMNLNQGKPKAPLHQFLLGDFQLQSWRTLKQ